MRTLIAQRLSLVLGLAALASCSRQELLLTEPPPLVPGEVVLMVGDQ